MTMSLYAYGDGEGPPKGEVGKAEDRFDQLWPLIPLTTEGELI